MPMKQKKASANNKLKLGTGFLRAIVRAEGKQIGNFYLQSKSLGSAEQE